jgi:hypothetical protein
MPFTSITSGSNTFVPRAPGIYPEDSLAFNDPRFEVRLSGATPNKDKSLSGSAVCFREKDVTVSGVTSRKKAVLSLSVYTDKDFTTAEVLECIKALYDFCNTTGNLSRLLQGES